MLTIDPLDPVGTELVDSARISAIARSASADDFIADNATFCCNCACCAAIPAGNETVIQISPFPNIHDNTKFVNKNLIFVKNRVQCRAFYNSGRMPYIIL